MAGEVVRELKFFRDAYTNNYQLGQPGQKMCHNLGVSMALALFYALILIS